MAVASVRPTVKAGDLRRRIVIQTSTPVSDGEGNAGVTWATFASAWAAIEPLTGVEFMSAAMMTDTLSHMVRMRYQPGVTTDMRVYEAATSLYLDIQAVIDIRDIHRQLHLMCQARPYEAI